MSKLKKFETKDLEILLELVGKELKNIFLQPVEDILSDGNMFVINFGNNEYSLHVSCFLRIRQGTEILLTSSDEYFDKNYNKLGTEIYDKASSNKFIDTLLAKNIIRLKKILKTAKVKDIQINEIADIRLIFDNNVIIEIVPDCLYADYEYYRLIDKSLHHHVILFCDGIISYEKL